MQIISKLKNLIDSFFLSLFPVFYMSLTRPQDSNDRFIFGIDLIKKYSKHITPSIIDVGCGSGNFYIYLKSLYKNCIYLGIEFDNVKIKLQKIKNQKFKIINQDLRKKLDLGKFDFVWSSEVIEHILDDNFFFENLVNSVKPDGYIIITTPAYNTIFKYNNKFNISNEVSQIEDGGHVKLGYTEQDLYNFANKNNLILIDIYYISECNDLRAKYMGRINKGIYCYIFNILYKLKIFRLKKYSISSAYLVKDNYYSIGGIFKKK